MNALLKPWTPEYPGALVYPANVDNVLGTTLKAPTHIVIHTPEEEADNYFGTPRWFAQYHPNQRGSTNAAIDFYGFVWECVPPNIAPIANGVIGKPYPEGADPNSNLNYTSRSVEVEGRAATMHLTCPRGSSQWNAVVKWCAFLCKKYGLGVSRIIAHRDVANNRSDPGTLDMNGLREDVQALLNKEDTMTPEQEAKLDLVLAVLGWGTFYAGDPNSTDYANAANLPGWFRRHLDLTLTGGQAALTNADYDAIATRVADKLALRLKD